jgi:hypothetical protein
MLKIRDEHLNAFCAQQASGFTARMVRHLREIFVTEVARLDDAKLHALIAKICATGEEWGVTEEPHFERLIELFVSFEELRLSPLSQRISDIVTYRGRSGARVLILLENALWFEKKPAIQNQDVVVVPFYLYVDQAFCDQAKRANAGDLPPQLLDMSGGLRALTLSPADRAYRREWKAMAAKMRKSRALPKKKLKSASVRWQSRTAGARFSPVVLPSKCGAITKVTIVSQTT